MNTLITCYNLMPARLDGQRTKTSIKGIGKTIREILTQIAKKNHLRNPMEEERPGQRTFVSSIL